MCKLQGGLTANVKLHFFIPSAVKSVHQYQVFPPHHSIDNKTELISNVVDISMTQDAHQAPGLKWSEWCIDGRKEKQMLPNMLSPRCVVKIIHQTPNLISL